MTRVYRATAILALLLGLLLGPSQAKADSEFLDEVLAERPTQFGLGTLLGQWVAVAKRTDGGAVEWIDESKIYFVMSEGGRVEDVELHTFERKWITESLTSPEVGVASGEFRYYPLAGEMHARIPQEVRQELEGDLYWTAKLDAVGPQYSPMVRLTFLRGEVEWTIDEMSGRITGHEIVGEGEPIEYFYRSDAIFSATFAPSKRIEILGFRGASAVLAEGESVTPTLHSMVQGQKIYPQAYLDEAYSNEVGARLPMTITGLQSGVTAEMSLESRRALENGETRYALALSRTSAPLGRPMTLAACGDAHEYFYPPFLTTAWIEEFFASDNLQATRTQGDCVPFKGISGEIVEFSIGDGAVFRIQWFERWEDQLLATYARMAGKFRVAIDGGGGPGSNVYSEMVDRYIDFISSDLLTIDAKIAISTLYFGGTAGGNDGGVLQFFDVTGPAPYNYQSRGGLIFNSEADIRALLTDRFSLVQYERLIFEGEFNSSDQTLANARSFAAAQFAQSCCAESALVSLEKSLVDRAIIRSNLAVLSNAFDVITTDGLRAAYATFNSFNPAAKAYTLFAREDAFGNKVTDEQYWSNVVDIASGFVTLGAITYQATSPLRFMPSTTNGRLVAGGTSNADFSSRSFRARLVAASRANTDPAIIIRGPNGTTVLPGLSGLGNRVPDSISTSQRRSLVVQAPEVELRIRANERVAPTESVEVVAVERRSPRRTTVELMSRDPGEDYGTSAKLVSNSPEMFRAANPEQPDNVAANFIVRQQTGVELTEAQGQRQLLAAMEGLSEGQPNMMPGAFTYGRAQQVPDGLFAARLRLNGIEAATVAMPDGLNLGHLASFVGGDYTAEVKVNVPGVGSRRVYVTQIVRTRTGRATEISFFDPARGQTLTMDAPEFAALVRTTDEPVVTLYRSRAVDGTGTRPISAKPNLADAAPTSDLPVSLTPEANTRFSFSNGGRQYTVKLGASRGTGRVNSVFEAPDFGEGFLARISNNEPGNMNAVISDLYGRRLLASPSIDPNVIEPMRVRETRLIQQSPTSIQVLEIVPEFQGTLANDIWKRQGNSLTEGQARAYLAAGREINANGSIWVDSHFNNFSFIRLEGADNWKVQIFDPGGIFPMKGATPAQKANLAFEAQTRAWHPTENQMDVFSRGGQMRNGAVREHMQEFITTYARQIDEVAMSPLPPFVGLYDATGTFAGNLWSGFQSPKIRRLAGPNAN
jgi:hypothetical protein